MTKRQEFPLKRVVIDIHDRVKCLEAAVEQLSATQMAYKTQVDDLVKTNRILTDHAARLLRQKEVLLEAIGRQALNCKIPIAQDYLRFLGGGTSHPMEPRR